MKPELILQADMLDILFENRNKDYGAYELRKQYDRRLYRSLGIIFTALVIIVAAWAIKSRFFDNAITRYREYEIPTTELSSVVDKPKIKIKERQRPQRNIAQTIFTKPTIIRQLVTNPPPEQIDLEQNQISTRNSDGDKLRPEEIIQSNQIVNGTGEKPTLPEPEEEKILYKSEVMPEFPGGEPALQRFLLGNIKTPSDAEPGTKLRVLMRFVVDKDGNVSGVEVQQSSGNDFDREVMRVVKKMPHWKPGIQNGKNVAVYFNLPVVLQVPEDN
jgi:protein TonB